MQTDRQTGMQADRQTGRETEGRREGGRAVRCNQQTVPVAAPCRVRAVAGTSPVSVPVT